MTITGQPAARAAAVSPPATEKASGKLEAPNTATGTTGGCIRRRSGRGSGTLFVNATSFLLSKYSPFSIWSAKRHN